MAALKITTGDLARALGDDFPPATDDMVREWVEAGLIDYWMNPVGRRYFLKPESIKGFLLEQLKFTQESLERVGERLGVRLA